MSKTVIRNACFMVALTLFQLGAQQKVAAACSLCGNNYQRCIANGNGLSYDNEPQCYQEYSDCKIDFCFGQGAFCNEFCNAHCWYDASQSQICDQHCVEHC